MEGQRSISSSGKVASPGNALATDIDGQVEVHGQEILLVDRLELQLEPRTCVCNIQRDAAVKLQLQLLCDRCLLDANIPTTRRGKSP